MGSIVEISKELDELNFEDLDFLIQEKKEVCQSFKKKIPRQGFILILIIVSYYLFKFSDLEQIQLGFFSVNNRNVIFRFYPVIIAFFVSSLMGSINSSLRSSHVLNLLYELRYPNLKNTFILGSLTDIIGTKKSTSSLSIKGLFGCLLIGIPVLMLIIGVVLAICFLVTVIIDSSLYSFEISNDIYQIIFLVVAYIFTGLALYSIANIIRYFNEVQDLKKRVISA